jgi:hypothetical protein
MGALLGAVLCAAGSGTEFIDEPAGMGSGLLDG